MISFNKMTFWQCSDIKEYM